MANVVVTGSQGFIGSFLCEQLLRDGHNVLGIDNFSKYGNVSRPHDSHRNFKLIRHDIAKSWPYQDVEFMMGVPNYIIAGAAMIGGISYFHKYAYDLLATNERIASNTFDAAIWYWEQHPEMFKRIVAMSSSMVFEGADEYDFITLDDAKRDEPWPTREDMIKMFPPPNSTYGFQKLAIEYFCKGANEQYSLPYVIVRPFNCVGIGEEEAVGEKAVMSGNVKMLMSHVLPDLIHKCLEGQDPLHILGDGSQVRCYTHGQDIARGICLAMTAPEAHCQDFNISVAQPTTVLELAELVWSKINPDKPFKYVSDEPFAYDVKRRIPDVSKARRILGFEAEIPLEQSVDEVISWMRAKCTR